jgi:hypothetical protein
VLKKEIRADIQYYFTRLMLSATPPNVEAQAILESAAKAAGLDKDVVRSAIRNIAAEPSTQFLLQLAG